MADYTEKASLLVIDGSSAKINKINQALNRLAQTATRTQSALNKLGGGNVATRINATAKAVNALARAQSKISKNTSIGVKLRGNSAADLRSMAKAMAQYKSASKNINTLIGSGSRSGGSYKNLDELTNKLVRVARAANMAANALGRAKANIPGRGGFNLPPTGGRGGRGGGGNNMIPRNIGLEIQPLKSFWRSAVVSLGHTIFNSIRDGFAEGIKGYDVADNKLNQQRITGDARERLRQQAFAGEQRAPIWRADERMDFYAEIGSNFRDPTDAAKFDKYVERAIYTAVQQGGNREEATTGIAQLFKGLGNAGYLQDAKGNLNADLGKYIEAYTAAKTSEGAQINFNDAAQLLKYARTSAQSLTPREFFLQLISAADIGASTQGVQLNMANKNFASDGATKKAIKAQEEAGLREPGEMVKSGQTGKKTTYTYSPGNVKDDVLFRENPNDWIKKYITGPGGFLAKQGLDAEKSNPAEILSALDPLSGNRNVDDFVAKAVLQAQERYIKLEKFFEKPITDEEMANTNAASSWVQLQETTQQLVSLFGNLGDKLENTFIPVIDTVGNWAQRLNNIIEGKSKGEMQDYAVLGGAGAVGVAGGLAGVKLLSLVATGFGLPAAATALTKSALDLSIAAAKLAGGSSIPDAAGKGKWNAAWLSLLGTIGVVAASGAVQSGSSADNEYLNADEQERQRLRNQARAQYELQSRSPELTENATQLGEWIKKLTEARTRYQYAQEQGLTPSSDYFQKAEIDFQTANDNVTRLQTSITEGSAGILAAFEAGGARIETASSEFGSGAADKLLGIAASFGSAAGEAMRQAIGTIGVNVNAPAAAPNTGTNTNLQTGG